MAYAMAEVDVNVSAEALYEFLADFGSVSWMQGVTKVEVEGQGPGMARSIYAGGTECVVEVLESLEPTERRVGYTITQNNPLPVADYLFHAAKKLYVLEELDLVESSRMRPFLNKLAPLLIHACPEIDRTMLAENLRHIKDGTSSTTTGARAIGAACTPAR